MHKLTHRQEKLLRSLRTRHGRKRESCCLCEGVRCCREILSSRPELLELAICSETFDCGDFPTLDWIVLSEKHFRELGATVASQGVLLVLRRPLPEPLSASLPDPFLLALDRIGDPGNLGTILRTAKAIGLREIWFTSGTVDVFNDKVIRSGLGAQFSMTLREFNDLDSLVCEFRRCGGRTVFRTDPHSGESVFSREDLFSGSALILGSEADGASALADAVSVTIPMPGGSESINVAQAATVLLFEAVRRGVV